MRKRFIIVCACIILGALLFYRWNIIGTKEQQSAEFLQENNEQAPGQVLDELALGNGDNVQLIYDGEGDVLIRLKDESILLRSGITEEMLFNNEGQNIRFKLHGINDASYVAVTEYYPTVNTYECTEKIFKIAGNHLASFWSSDEIQFKLINGNKDRVEISCSLGSEPIILYLTEEEGRLVDEKSKSLEENGVKIDDSFWKSIQDNILRDITACNWTDIDKDGDDELIISLFCHTVGAITPVHLEERGIMIFEMGDSLELRQLIFERDNSDENLEPYFTGEA